MLDNVLKPLLLGRGVAAPMLVVFIGAIGGLLFSGIIGLFIGPVVLVVSFTVVEAWLSPKGDDATPGADDDGEEKGTATSTPASASP
ncbi:putative inner membrane protein [compost metagenome]